MKTLISLGLIAFIAMVISFAIPSESYAGGGYCNRYLDTSQWTCYEPPSGNCCDDVVVYG